MTHTYDLDGERMPVFTNCNVCGIKLRTDDEEEIGMCDRCADAVIVEEVPDGE